MQATESASAPLRSHGPLLLEIPRNFTPLFRDYKQAPSVPPGSVTASFLLAWLQGREGSTRGFEKERAGGRGNGQNQNPTLQSSQMADWMTSAACFAAKEAHRCSLSFPSQLQPSNAPIPPRAKMAVTWEHPLSLESYTTSHSWHDFFFSSQAQVLHISSIMLNVRGLQGQGWRHVLKSVPQSFLAHRILIQIFLLFGKRSHQDPNLEIL